MSYTPKFQKILDDIKEAHAQKASAEEIHTMFLEGCRSIGQVERLCNLYRIRPKRATPGQKSRMSFFYPNKMQLEYLKGRTNRDMILKMRQGGVTTLSCMVALDSCLFTEGFNAGIMAHVKDNVKKIFRITKNAFLQFQRDWGDFYPVTNVRDNVSELGIKETGAELFVATETKGLTLDFLHISEAAFVDDSRISESIESVPFSGRVVLETTPDTASGMFYEMWDNYWKEESHASFKGWFFPWWYQYPEKEDIETLTPKEPLNLTDKEQQLVHEHGLTDAHIVWRRMKVSEVGGDEGEFMRKYPEDPRMCFLSGARSVFPAGALNSMWKNEKVPTFVGSLVAA